MLTFLMSMVLVVVSAFLSFSTSSANASTGGYVPLASHVRDVYSREILFQAQPRLRFVQFVKIKYDLQAVRGKSIVFTKYNNLSGGGAINEADTISKDNLAASEIIVNVSEHAKAIEVTELLIQQSLHNVLAEASKTLANNLAIVVNTQLRDTALSTSNSLLGNGALANAAAFNAATAAEQAFSTATVKSLTEALATNDAPRFNGDFYVCFIHPHSARQIKDDANWINANTYMGRRQLYAGEIGMYDGMIFIDTTNMPYYAAAADAVAAGWTGITVDETYASVAMGENAIAWGIAVEAELRDDGIQDFGRKHALAWYGMWGSAILEEKNVFKVLTA
jgi:N4-gp56 family major capsid protein